MCSDASTIFLLHQLTVKLCEMHILINFDVLNVMMKFIFVMGCHLISFDNDLGQLLWSVIIERKCFKLVRERVARTLKKEKVLVVEWELRLWSYGIRVKC